jgi:hypothetical protein
MLVREKCDAHGQSLDLTPASPPRTHSGWFVKSP